VNPIFAAKKASGGRVEKKERAMAFQPWVRKVEPEI
jgi:hypothetical protein